MTTSIVILQLIILGVALESDLGRRKIGWFRVLRPVISIIAIVPHFVTSLPTSARDLALQGAGLLAGVLAGLACVSPRFVSVGFDPAYRSRLPWAGRKARPAAVSHAGLGYAAIWIAATGTRLAFAWGAQHVFPAQFVQFMATHQLSATALVNAFIFLAIAMSMARGARLAVRGRAARRQYLAQAGTGAPAVAGVTARAR